MTCVETANAALEETIHPGRNQRICDNSRTRNKQCMSCKFNKHVIAKTLSPKDSTADEHHFNAPQRNGQWKKYGASPEIRFDAKHHQLGQRRAVPNSFPKNRNAARQMLRTV